MVQVAKSIKAFELFGGLNPGAGTVQASKNSKAAVILSRCAVLGPATTE